MSEVPTPTEVMDLALVEHFPDGSAAAFDIRAEEGVPCIIEAIRAKVDARMSVGIWDSDDVMPGFALVRPAAVYIVSDGDSIRGSFATLEAALKHGLTMWKGYRRDR